MRVLVCSFSEPSYLYPLIGVASELARRGHEVAFASGQKAATKLEEQGFARIPRGRADGPSFEVRAWAKALATAIDVKHVEYAVTQFKPDVLVAHQLGQAAVIVRERSGIPTAIMGLFSYLWPVGRPVHPRLFAANEPTREWRLGDNLRCLNEARALFRLPPIACPPDESPLLGDLFMLRTAPYFEPELDALPERVHAVGPCLWEPARDDERSWDDVRRELAQPEAPLIYAQQGRTFGGPGFWRSLVDAAADLPVQVFAVTGRMDVAVGALPRNVTTRDFVPQGIVLPHARLVVSGGHSTAVLGALTHGKPQIVVTGGGETVDNAERIEIAGCGIRIDETNVDAHRMRAAITRVLDDVEMREASDVARARLGRPDDFGAAAGLIECLARNGSPARSSARRPDKSRRVASAPAAGVGA